MTTRCTKVPTNVLEVAEMGALAMTGQPFLKGLRVHKAVVQTCGSMVDKLGSRVNVYPGVGCTTMALCGPEMCGKTTTLKGIVFALPILRPDVVPIYTDVTQLLLRGADLPEVIADEVAQALGLTREEMQRACETDDILYGARLALHRANKRMFLVLDEIEAIWARPRQEDGDARPHYSYVARQMRAFSLLYHLGNTGDSVITTLVCGSTASLPDLVDGNAKPTDAFPVQRISLNHTKYITQRLASHAPTDKAAAEIIVKALQPSLAPADLLAKANAVLFAAGANLLTAGQLLRGPPPTIEVFPDMKRIPESDRKYVEAAIEVLLDTNAAVLELFMNALNTNAPLPDSALVKGVNMDALGRTFRRIGPSSMESARVLHQLSDTGVVCVPDWQEAVVYPPSALHLLAWRLYREGMDRQQQQGQHRANVNAKLVAWLSSAASLRINL